ncbi:MAG: hypothetical protein ABI670_01980 [Chloroflexota bacterium]
MFHKRLLAIIALLPVLGQLTALSGSTPVDRQLRISELAMYKYEGFQPYDVVARVLDGRGSPVDDAYVTITSASAGSVEATLRNSGRGYYVGCDLDWVDAPSGSLTTVVRVSQEGSKPTAASVRDHRGNYCGAGEPQIRPPKVSAAKQDGDKKPLDIQVEVVDETGAPVQGAFVFARATDFVRFVDAPLQDVGHGKYLSCNFGQFNSKGAGAISIHVSVSARGYRPAENDGTNKVGRLCESILPSEIDISSHRAMSPQ